MGDALKDFKCRFLDQEGWCHGKYKGFKCIGDKCKYFEAKKRVGCKHFSEGYCEKYGRFFCPGKRACEEGRYEELLAAHEKKMKGEKGIYGYTPPIESTED